MLKQNGHYVVRNCGRKFATQECCRSGGDFIIARVRPTWQTLDVTVSSMGNAKSLSGGTLLMTPLKGADGQVYAMSQGNILVGGVGATANGSESASQSFECRSHIRRSNGRTRQWRPHWGRAT